MAGKKLEFKYSIVAIYTRLFEFQENLEDLSVFDSSVEFSKHLNLDVMVNLIPDREKEEITIDIFSEVKEVENGQYVFRHGGRTVYHVEGLLSVYDEENDDYAIPPDFLQSLKVMAYSHARALHAVSLSTSMYKDKFFLPIIDSKIFLEDSDQTNE